MSQRLNRKDWRFKVAGERTRNPAFQKDVGNGVLAQERERHYKYRRRISVSPKKERPLHSEQLVEAERERLLSLNSLYCA